MGGLLAAAALNVAAVIRLSIRRELGELVGTVAIKARPWNVGILLLRGLLATLAGYLFLENFVAK